MTEAPQHLPQDTNSNNVHQENNQINNSNSPQNSPVSTNQAKRIRVKVFVRDNSDGEWIEKGTGYLFTGVEENESPDGPVADEQKCMHVISETDGTKVLQSLIDPLTVHEKQEETIIVWAEAQRECALSFQYKQDCDEIFTYIQTVKKTDPSCSSDFLAPSENCLELPKCDENDLEALADALDQCLIYSEAYEFAIEQGDYLNKIMQVIKDHHGDESFDANRKFVCRIVMSFVYFNKQHILDVLMSTENIFHTIEALQYDPQSSELTKNHRDIVENQSSLKHLISASKDEILKEKIQHTYYMQYILDNFFVTHNSMDKSRISTLYSAIHLNKVEIVSIVLEHTDELANLIGLLKNEFVSRENCDASLAENNENRINVLQFFHELCDCVSPIDKKDDFFNILTELNFYEGLYSLIKSVKSKNDNKSDLETCKKSSKIARLAVGLIKKLIEFNIDSFHRFTYKSRSEAEESEEKNICDLLIEIMHADLFDIENNSVLPVRMDQITDIMTSIAIFSELLGNSFNEREYNMVTLNCFKSDFFNHYAHKIFAPLTIDCTNDKNFSRWHGFLLDNLLRFMSQILGHIDDFNRFYAFLSRNDTLNKMGHLVSLNNYFFINEILTIVSSLFFNSDQVVQRNVVRTNLVDQLFKAVPECTKSHNIFTGGLSDMLNKIRTNSKHSTLMSYVCENYDQQLKIFDITPSYQDLKDRYQELKTALTKMDINGIVNDLTSDPSVALKNSENAFFDEIREEKYFDGDKNIVNQDSKDTDPILPSESKKSKLSSQYDNIFMDLKMNGPNKTDHLNIPGLYSPRPHDPLNKKININLTSKEEENLNDSAEDLGLDKNNSETVPTAALVDYSTSSEEDEDSLNKDQKDVSTKNKENLKKLDLDIDGSE